MVRMKLFLKDKFAFLKEKSIQTAAGIFSIIFVVALFILSYSWKKLPPEIPLFYSLPWGEDQLAQKSSLSFLLFSTLGLSIANFVLITCCYKKETLATKILAWSAVFIMTLTTITIAKIIFLII